MEFTIWIPVIAVAITGIVQIGIAWYIVHHLAPQKTAREQRVKDKRAALIALFKAKGGATGDDAYNKFASELGTLEAAFADAPSVLAAVKAAYPDAEFSSADALNKIVVEALVDSELCTRDVAEKHFWLRAYTVKSDQP